MMRKIAFFIVLSALILCIPPVSADDSDTVRQAGAEYAKAGEGVMVDGPFYLNEKPYWIVDYVKKGEAQASLVYDLTARRFVTDSDVMSRVFGTRAFKNVTMVDPLFYAVGDPSVIPLGARYETQNVRNFAGYSPLDPDEIEMLEAFLTDYEIMSQKIADAVQLTNALLRPGVDITVSYAEYPMSIVIEEQSATGSFSYEGCQQLLEAYEDIYSDYPKLMSGIKKFTGSLEDVPPGTVIRQKRGIKITKESVLGEIELAEENGQELRRDIDYRSSVLNGDYSDEIKTGVSRLGKEEQYNLKIGIIIAIIIAVLLLRYMRRRPGTPTAALIVFAVLLALATPAATQEIPTPEELLSQQVVNASQVEIRIFTDVIDNETARSIVEGYPLILEGESVYVSGPYYHEGEAYYLFDVVDNGVPTGSVILVDAPTLHMVGSFRIADRVVRTSFLSSMVQQKPLYSAAEAGLLESEAMKASDSTIAVFLVRLAENVRDGKELEKNFTEMPSFETARDLARNYKQGFLLLDKMRQVASPAEAGEVTHGFAGEAMFLEGYYLTMHYPITNDYLQVSQSRYRGRSLNRIPMMKELVDAGLAPSKLQVTHDLTTDLIYGNNFIWRLGKVDTPYFASLPRKVGEASSPEDE